MTQGKNPEEETSGEAQSAPQDQATPDGLIVTVETDERGERTLGITTMGATSVIEVPTLLELANRKVRAQLGI